MTIRIFASVFILACSVAFPLGAEERQSEKSIQELTPDEQELIGLARELNVALEAHMAAAKKLSGDKEIWDFHLAQYPDRIFIPRLLEFERKHSGTRAGLMALRKVVHLCGSGVPYPGELPWFEVLRRLPAYLDREESIELIRYVDANAIDPKLEQPLRNLADYPNANPMCHEYCEMMLANWMLNVRNSHEYCVRRIRELDDGETPLYSAERSRLEERLGILPTDEAAYRKWEVEAVEILKRLVQQNSPHRRPAIKQVDSEWFLIEKDEAKSLIMPRICEIAAGTLFKEQHLRIGKPGPNLEVQLMTGEPWSLLKQGGKVVVIQFSFTGCGPCEGMYEDMKKLQAELGDRVSILTVMGDDMKSDTEAGISAGKLTWNVTWEKGTAGPLATQWGVKSFPTVYVFDRQGRVAAYGFRNQALTAKVRELIERP